MFGFTNSLNTNSVIKKIKTQLKCLTEKTIVEKKLKITEKTTMLEQEIERGKSFASKELLE